MDAGIYGNVGIYENFTKHIDCEEVDTILELGARDGLYTESYIDFYNPKELYSIDCNPNCSGTIVKNTEHLDKVFFYPLALSDKNGTVDFFINHRCEGSSSMFDHPHYQTSKISVTSKTLDTFCKDENIKKIDLIIADVEGAESMIFKNQEILKTVKYIICEVKYQPDWKGKEFPDINDLTESLSSFGFKLVEKTILHQGEFGDSLWIRE